ncbi:MAG: IS200/IS605 family transposase [Phycisphaerae bacterium]|nr:IS200/IS605 family transposase [Phycisphaerae bacterium]
MPRNVYSDINLHLTWHTKHDAPVLVDTVENRTHHYLRHRALQTPDVIVHEVGGTEDHVHLAVSIPPTVVIADWIGELKGSCSHHINHEVCNRKVLAWQDGYGVVSFGAKDLAWVVSYVRNQRKHHAEGRVYDRVERTDRLEERAPERNESSEDQCDEEAR